MLAFTFPTVIQRILLGIFLFLAYSCVTTNAAPHNQPYKRLLTGLVAELPNRLDSAELFEPPKIKFTNPPQDTAVESGSSLVLTCEATGIPPPVIRWTFNGEEVRQGKYEEDDNTLEKLLNLGLVTIENGVTISKLKIDCVTPQHAGKYFCVANNGHETIETSAEVVVEEGEGEATCLSKKSESGSGPVIYMWTDGRFEREGATAQLFCRARGTPDPKITWRDSEGGEIRSGETYTILPNGDLLMKDVNFELMDVYTCEATNEHGTDTATAFFYPTEREAGMESTEGDGQVLMGVE
jgi:hypothetical protein